MEYPLIRYITESTPYSDDEIKQYVVQAIKQGEISYKTVNDEIEETPFMTKTVLKGCRENSLLSNKKKAQFKKIEDRVKEVSKDSSVREAAKDKEEGKKKGRLASQSEMAERESQSKTVQIVSPKTS